MRTVFTLLFLLSSIYSFSQLVKGRVVDQSGRPIIGVNVIIEGTGTGTSSAVNGEFEIEIPSKGKYIKCSSIGFDTKLVSQNEWQKDSVITIVLTENLYQLPEVIVGRETMTGGLSGVMSVPGSAHYLNLQALNKFSYADINRILRNVPGLNIQEEDGFGLRPNIGMRGTGVERSSKITLMEDGILMAPAPYTAPSAYYFPSVGRMQGIEVRKGSSQIKYGPYTTGGAVNLISTRIPNGFSSKINLLGGSYGRRTVHAMMGQSFEYGGIMLETFQHGADGFKQLDNGGPTGFNSEDYLAKVRINTRPGAKVYQSLTVKAGQAKGDSDETYLGLTRNDFEITPLRRYSASQLDNINTRHTQYSFKYNVLPLHFMDISITGYQNKFTRNWYKLDKVKYGTGAKVDISQLLDDPAAYTDEYAILTGATSPNSDALLVKANNRNYYSRGIQLVTGFNFKTPALTHDIETSIRFHRDEEDRFQWEDQYKMDAGDMMRTSSGIPGTESNRVTDAEAISAYVQYNLQFKKWRFTPGLRMEDVLLSRTDYGKADPARQGTDAVRSNNHIMAWIPGAAIEYSHSKQISSFAGIHKGFAPPGPAEGALPENSINYEVGIRLNQPGTIFQLIGFYNDYENLLGADLAASGGGGSGDLFNAGQAIIYGLEAELNYNLPFTLKELVFPISVAYTLTSGEFLSSFNALNEDWGTVTKGDRLPYLSNHQLTFNAGIEHKTFDIQVSSKFNSAMRTSPGMGEITKDNKINENFVIDISSNIRLNQYFTAFASVNNLMDAVYVVAQRPAGLRPGMPRSFVIGLKMNL